MCRRCPRQMPAAKKKPAARKKKPARRPTNGLGLPVLEQRELRRVGGTKTLKDFFLRNPDVDFGAELLRDTVPNVLRSKPCGGTPRRCRRARRDGSPACAIRMCRARWRCCIAK